MTDVSVSWSGLSPSVKTAFGWARAATSASAPVGSPGLLLGILRSHLGYSEPDALLAHMGGATSALTGELKRISPELDVDVRSFRELSEIPELAPEADLVVGTALELASSYDAFRDGILHVPHLFGGILRSGSGTRVDAALQVVLGESKEKARDDYLDYMRELVRNRSLKYSDFLAKHPLVASLPESAPPPPDPFVDRERELEKVRTALGKGQHVFISGPPGVGKTALALRIASEDVAPSVMYLSGYTHAEAAMREALARSADVLVIVDDADELDVGRLLEPVTNPAIVITRKPPRGGPRRAHVALEPLGQEDIERLLSSIVPESVSDLDLVQLLPLVGGLASNAGLVGTILSWGVRALDLIAEWGVLLEETRSDGNELSKARLQHAKDWKELEPRYKGRQNHEKRLFRAASLLESPFTAAQAAAASEMDAADAEVVLADLAAVGLVVETEGARWSLSEAARTFAWKLLADEPETVRQGVCLRAIAARHEIGSTESEPPALAGFRSDKPSDVDHIGFAADVEALCSVLIAQKVDPPISVGLFGEWGTGKSTFMRLMRDRVRALQDEWKGRDDSPFCRSVKQINFNAWNYSDANLWASLVTRIFEGLSKSDPEIKDDAELRAGERAAMVSALTTAKATIAEKEAERDEAEKRHAELESRLSDIEARVTSAGERLSNIRPAEVIERARTSEKVQALGKQVLERAQTNGNADAVAVARELRSTWGFLVHSARMLGRKRVLLVAGATLAFLLTVGVAEVSGVPVAGTVAAVVGLLGSLAAIARKPVERARQAAAAADDLLTGLREEEQAAVRREEAEVQRELDELAARRAHLDADIEVARSAASRAGREIEDIRSGRLITQFVEERAVSSEYRQHLGLIALIRNDFDELTRLMLDAEVPDKPPFDRIILYIDDLDRCRAELVVQVLEAVHLLLALRLFVVVVGVDPRWLAQSLKRHYIGQLGLEDGDEPDPEAEEWATTPQNYLEKIFQIPFALRPMGTNGFKSMMGALFEVRTVGRHPDGPDGSLRPATGEEPEAQRGATSADTNAVASTSNEAFRKRTLELLRIWPAELEFIHRLGALVPTPRAAKRLANTYRLLRVRQDTSLSRFVERDGQAGEYQVALVLLTIVVGFSDIADDVFRQVLESTLPSFSSFVEELAPPADASSREGELYKRLGDGLRLLESHRTLPNEMVVYREWVPRVARYSFETARIPWDDAGPANSA